MTRTAVRNGFRLIIDDEVTEISVRDAEAFLMVYARTVDSAANDDASDAATVDFAVLEWDDSEADYHVNGNVYTAAEVADIISRGLVDVIRRYTAQILDSAEPATYPYLCGAPTCMPNGTVNLSMTDITAHWRTHQQEQA